MMTQRRARSERRKTFDYRRPEPPGKLLRGTWSLYFLAPCRGRQDPGRAPTEFLSQAFCTPGKLLLTCLLGSVDLGRRVVLSESLDSRLFQGLSELPWPALVCFGVRYNVEWLARPQDYACWLHSGLPARMPAVVILL